jgi:hypothetical protein
MNANPLINLNHAASKSFWTVGAVGLFFLLVVVFLILVNTTSSSHDNKQSEDSRVDTDEPQSQNWDNKEEVVTRILGQRVEQSITFLVTTPPSEVVPVLHAGAKYTSIQRLLVINLANMTWEACKPKESYYETDNVDDDEQHNEKDESGDISWEKGKHILSIHSIMNVTAHARLGTLEVTYDPSVQDTSETMKKNLKVDQVTIDNWAKDDGGQHKRHRRDECLASCDIDENSLVGNGSLSINTSPSFISGDGIDSKQGKDRKNHSRREKSDQVTVEYTFTSEFDAGKFQTLVLVMRTVGREVQHLYNALESIHKNSEAYIEVGDVGGVALDDVIRCLGDIPFVRKKINNIRNQMARADDEDNDESSFDNESLGYDGQSQRTTMYKSKRLVIGFVDFVGLLIPNILRGTPYSSPVAAKEDEIELFDSNVGGINEHQARIQQLVKLRQRVASAAVRVRSYVKAMKVVQEGWNVVTTEGDFHQIIHHRLTFDDDVSNSEHDCISQNECYDPNLWIETRRISSALDVPQQAYMLVSCNVVQLEQHFIEADPVLLIPSLQQVLSKNKDLDFFVISLVHHEQQAVTILLYTRCLPPGIDANFDSSLKRFCDSPEEIRNQSLNVCIRIGKAQIHIFCKFHQSNSLFDKYQEINRAPWSQKF